MQGRRICPSVSHLSDSAFELLQCSPFPLCRSLDYLRIHAILKTEASLEGDRRTAAVAVERVVHSALRCDDEWHLRCVQGVSPVGTFASKLDP
eukprot:scaffold49988_cov36-Tisochrysis_lutea.AAC.4